MADLFDRIVDLLIKLADDSVQLAEATQQRADEEAAKRAKETRRRFDQLARPLFENLEAVHRDYLALLQETRRVVETASPGAAAEYLESRRRDADVTRAKLWAAEGEMLSKFRSEPGPWCDFGYAVWHYLHAPIGAQEYDSWPSQMSYGLLQELHRSSSDTDGVTRIVPMIDQLISHVRTSWADTASTYERLKIAVFANVNQPGDTSPRATSMPSRQRRRRLLLLVALLLSVAFAAARAFVYLRGVLGW
jgi:hypothetical protein